MRFYRFGDFPENFFGLFCARLPVLAFRGTVFLPVTLFRAVFFELFEPFELREDEDVVIFFFKLLLGTNLASFPWPKA